MAIQVNSPLPPGTLLGRWRIERALSAGGFSIVYLGRSPAGAPMAIKEYMPSKITARKKGHMVKCETPDGQRPFDAGLKDFFREAEAISRIDSPAVTRAEDFFLANGTAYLVMPFEHGRTLRAYMAGADKLDDGAIQRVFHDALEGLHMLHENQILHLDLKPSNLWIRADGSAMILDFGTARIGPPDMNAPAPMLTPGFAAPEQRRPVYRADLLGPWTDFYNLAATLYSVLEDGLPPPKAEDRAEKDEIHTLAERWAGRASEPLLRWADKALRLDLRQRPQTAEEGLLAVASFSAQPERQIFWEWASNGALSLDADVLARSEELLKKRA